MISPIARAWNSLKISLVILGGFTLFTTANAQLTLQRTMVNLVDSTPGDDRWSASYTLGGVLPTFNQGFTIFFDHLSYRDLNGPITPVGSDWDALLIQPDPGLSAPGFFDALSLTSSPTFTGPFTIEFTWLGAGDPGAQDYEVYTLDGGFSILQRGQVGAIAVPEPVSFGGSAVLTLLSFAMWQIYRRRTRSVSAGAL